MDYHEEEVGQRQFRGPIIAIGREEVVLDMENSKRTPSGRRSHGFHLVRSKWDPYPWIGSVENGSSAEAAGLRSGDCLLEVDGSDALGLEMKDIAHLISRNERVSLSVWRRPGGPEAVDPGRQEEERAGVTLLEGPLPEVARKLVRAVSGLVKALECPVCLESAAPPVSQCVHGHLLCFGCRLKTARCPVCRVRLGQGRCLLADKAHRALSESLLDQPADQPTNRSLHDSIFGKARSPQRTKASPPAVRRSDGKHHLLSRLLARGAPDERNASTESLPTSSCAMDGNLLYGRRWLLRLYDRRKSASTGELNAGEGAGELEARGSGSTLSVPQTPVWGGSTESMATGKILCPLRDSADCKETLDPASLLEHLRCQHSSPLLHFHKKVTLPVPFPFHEEKPVYVLHQDEQAFVLQCDNDKVWISTYDTNNRINWQWALHAVTTYGTEINLRKEVIYLQEPFELLSQHTVELTKNFSVPSITISLIKLDADEGCIKAHTDVFWHWRSCLL